MERHRKSETGPVRRRKHYVIKKQEPSSEKPTFFTITVPWTNSWPMPRPMIDLGVLHVFPVYLVSKEDRVYDDPEDGDLYLEMAAAEEQGKNNAEKLTLIEEPNADSAPPSHDASSGHYMGRMKKKKKRDDHIGTLDFLFFLSNGSKGHRAHLKKWRREIKNTYSITVMTASIKTRWLINIREGPRREEFCISPGEGSGLDRTISLSRCTTYTVVATNVIDPKRIVKLDIRIGEH